ncbi:hypothetical protein, partial [Flavobacterium sp. WLB]|uniref:hypothetical protein n=1 Tax=Flavobacterium sp. WLB TaxID=2161662 RepID=UPI0013FE373E
GTITVNANKAVGAASSSPNVCINTAITNVTHTTTGSVTGIAKKCSFFNSFFALFTVSVNFYSIF